MSDLPRSVSYPQDCSVHALLPRSRSLVAGANGWLLLEWTPGERSIASIETAPLVVVGLDSSAGFLEVGVDVVDRLGADLQVRSSGGPVLPGPEGHRQLQHLVAGSGQGQQRLDWGALQTGR